MKRRLKRLALLALGTLLYGWALLCCQRAGEQMGITCLNLSREIDARSVAEITTREAEQESPIRFCFWGQGGEETVSDSLTGRSRQVSVVYLAGNPELAGGGSLAWQSGCLVDAETARTLFGTEICGGQSLSRQGEVYPVLGTISGTLPQMVVMAQREDGDVMNRCLLEAAPEQGKALGESFLLRHGLEGKCLDLFPFWALTVNLCLVFPGFLLLSLWSVLGRGWRELALSQIRGQWRTLARVLLSLGLTVGTVWLLGRNVVIPPDMVPSRWSDFSFWGNWWQNQKENFFLLTATAPYGGQLQTVGNMIKSMGNNLAAILLAVWAVRGEHHADTAD